MKGHANMLATIGKRLITVVPTLIGIVIVTFLLTRVLPGDPAVYFAGPAATPDSIAEIRKNLGFDRPLPEQFLQYVNDLAHGNFGNSLSTGRPVATEIASRLPASAELTLFGLILSIVIAVPLGILAGSSATFQAAINPLVQLFRPVSPLAWLPIVTLIVSAVYVTTAGETPLFQKSFLVSAITVTLCSLWTTLINTAVGVTSVDKDLVNVGKVLQLPLMTRVRKIILPSALPYIFTGMRLSLGVGWMVLIAAEMLAQNPGLGKFVWDEFQNGSSDSLSRIMVAVFTIGIIGFLLDRVMFGVQALVDFRGER
jgi:nitrate/nitrite transport system permease protein